ncbi:hypothetical protein [Variovorax sp. OV329]|uniref:hypothetical protein n=1 Tax=Variovorax sp. OV329 TaxID=1882825 RepID=UPI0008E9A22D|nr:hypothetical protein [Variovorax sp. OV329]SFN21763.1 hypothetical protein SAMN05444747_11856 [Variovorax sp. OV329]
MAKSARALTRKSGNSKSDKDESADRKPERKARSAAIHALDKLEHLRETLRAFECLQGFLTPQHLPAFQEEFYVDPGELRALVRCINAETRRRMQAVGVAMESVRQALH